MGRINVEHSSAAVIVALLASPWLLSKTTVPDAVFANQLLAVTGWGLWLGVSRPDIVPERRVLIAVATALASLCLAALAALRGGGESTALVVLSCGVIVLATSVRRSLSRHTSLPALALAIAGCLSVLTALVQYFVPSLADGTLIAANTSPGRAIGNMRQPNHLATALLCAMVWIAWLWQAGRCAPRLSCAAIVSMVVAVALSASRTGALSLGVLVFWAWVDRSLPRSARWTLAFTPLVYVLIWAALAAGAAVTDGHFYAAERLQSGGDPSSSRFAIWRNASALIVQQPWAGVGWGHFNFAWTFTPFPDRPVAFFDHAHNLPLQLAVELGLPAAVGVLGLLALSLWLARGSWHAVSRDPAHPARAALAMLAVLCVHSLLEYPLWYAYFLLPGAWALGLFLGSATATDADCGLRPAPRWWAHAARSAGVLMLVGTAYAAWDHRRIEAIFAPVPGAAPLAERIAEGQKSFLFGHHADYAAVTNEPGDQRLQSFRRPLRQLVDVRLLIAYIEALRANGRTAEALYAAQRLREFRRDDAQAYFEDCGREGDRAPWQCELSPVPLGWRDLNP